MAGNAEAQEHKCLTVSLPHLTSTAKAVGRYEPHESAIPQAQTVQQALEGD